MRELALENSDLKVLVDDEDYHLLTGIKWYLAGSGYVYGYFGYDQKRLVHRVLLGLKDSKTHVDHINGDPLDCRRCNLRLCTNQQNTFNSKKRSTNKSGYKGVSWSSKYQKWRASITRDGRHNHLGLFDNPEDAARAYDKMATKLFEEFAWLNFPDEDNTQFEDGITRRKGRHGNIFQTKTGRWGARLKRNGKIHWVGTFDSREEAQNAVNKVVEEEQCQTR